jgi:hypothetical protein
MALLIAFGAAAVIFGTICLVDRPVKDPAPECHAAPLGPYTLAEAEAVWQMRIGCADYCADKNAVLDALRLDGRFRMAWMR